MAFSFSTDITKRLTPDIAFESNKQLLEPGMEMGLGIYVGLLLLTPKVLSLPFDPQDNSFLSSAHSYTAFHIWSNCWVCRVLPSLSIEDFQWWVLHFKENTFFNSLMTSNNLKMNWYNILYLIYGHNVTFDFDYVLTWFNDYFPAHKKFRSSFCLPRHWLGLDSSVTLVCSKWDLLDMSLLPMGVASPWLDKGMHPRSNFYSWLHIFKASREAY